MGDRGNGRARWAGGGREPFERRGLGSLLAWALVLLGLFAGRGAAAQGCALAWRPVMPCPAFSPLVINAMAYDGSTFVGVGNGGYVLTSPDGRTWTQRPCPIDADLTTVAAANGRFVASGMAYPGGPPATVTSADGTDWSVQWGSGGWPLQGAGGLVFRGRATSPDGRLWTPFYLPTDEGYSDMVAYGNGMWMKVHGQGDKPALVYTSTDAQTWTLMRQPPFTSAWKMVFGGTHFVVLGDGLCSTRNGRTWTKAAAPAWSGILTYANNRFVLLSKAETWFSKNGSTWTHAACDLPPYSRISWLFWTGQAFIAVGDQGQMTQYVFESPDALHWTVRPLCGGSGSQGGQVRYFEEPGLFVSAGSLMTSPDGQAWSAPSTPGSTNGVAYGDGTFVAAGARGSALWSGDGQSWTESATGAAEDLYDVAYGAGLFVAVGARGRVVTSPDGRAWTLRPSFYFSDLRSIVFAQGSFLAVGYSTSSAILSGDGLAWESVDLGRPFLSYPGPTASFALGRFLVAGPDGLVVSPDGRTWSAMGDQYTMISGNVVEWEGRAYAPGYGAGEMTSSDLQTWTRVPTNGIDRPAQGQSLATDGRVLVLGGGSVLLWGTCAPYVDTVTPGQTPDGAPATVTLQGSGFSPVTRVRFGEVPATSFTVLSDGQIEAVAPPLPPGIFAVTADAGDGVSVVSPGDVLRAGVPAVYGACPSVLSVSPSYFHFLTLWGKGLAGVTDLQVPGAYTGGIWGGGEDAVSLWLWPTVTGHADARLLFNDGSALPVPGGLTFVDPPVISSVKVIKVPFQIVVRGTNFTPDLLVEFNGVLLPAKFKSPQKLSVSGSRLVQYLSPTSNTLRLVSGTAAVRSDEFTFAQ